MKRIRLGALLTTLALTFSLSPVSAHAATFQDIGTHWAKPYIEAMAAKGLAKGYTETAPDGSKISLFRPDSKMTYAETLLFCARAMGINTKVQEKIEDDLEEEIRARLPSSIAAWNGAVREFAVDVEAGVLSLDELDDLSKTNPNSPNASQSYLQWTINREELSRYLVRAMQLEPLAKSLSSYPLDRYRDAESITASLRPYVFLLTNYGIVVGDDQQNFCPKKEVTRCEMITMLSRILDVMDRRGITVELSEYTSYPWSAGVIHAATQLKDGTVVVTLNHVFTGAQERYTFDNTVPIYSDNMLGSPADLREGVYARLNLDSAGRVSEVRLSGTLTEYEGNIASLADGVLALTSDMFIRSFTINRFTQVEAGGTQIDRSMIDTEAGYERARCWVDKLGRLVAVRFLGGTQTLEGLIEGVEMQNGQTVLSVASFDGVVHPYLVSSDCPVSADGELRSLTADDVGKHVYLRMSNDVPDQLQSVIVDSVKRYVQGAVTTADTKRAAPVITIADAFTGKKMNYTVNPNAAVTYWPSKGTRETRYPSEIQRDWFVTALLDSAQKGNVIASVEAYPGTRTDSGVLTEIRRGKSTVLKVADTAEGTMEYTLDMDELPVISREGKDSSVVDLRVGDSLVLTLRHNKIIRLEATPRPADLTGTITAIHRSMDGTTIDVKVSDGNMKSYSISEALTIRQNGALTGVSALAPGQSVALVTQENDLLSLEIVESSISATSVTGRVWQTTSSSNGELWILLDDGQDTPLRVVVTRGTQILSATTGKELSVSDLAADNMVSIRGSYSASAFNATIIIKE